MSKDGMMDFEENNYMDLVEMFMTKKAVRELWEQFVSDEYINSKEYEGEDDENIKD